MGYPCHLSISNPCLLMEDGAVYGHPPKDRVRMSRYFVGVTFRWSSFILLPNLSVMGILPYVFLWKKRMCPLILSRTMPIRASNEIYFTPLPYGLGHPFLFACKGTPINPHHQTSLLKKSKIFVDLRNTSYLCTRFAINNGNQRYNNTIN